MPLMRRGSANGVYVYEFETSATEDVFLVDTSVTVTMAAAICLTKIRTSVVSRKLSVVKTRRNGSPFSVIAIFVVAFRLRRCLRLRQRWQLESIMFSGCPSGRPAVVRTYSA